MISIVICSIDPAKFQFQKQQYARLLFDEPHEIVGVHDARSLCEGYNRGVAHARKDADAFIFAHDDIEILSLSFRDKLKRHLSQYDVVGVAGTTKLGHMLWSLAGPPHIFGAVAHPKPPPLGTLDVEIFAQPFRSIANIQALDGLFIAARRAVVEKVRWDDETFDGWHGYDVDWTFSAHLAGFKLAVACDIAIAHGSIGKRDKAWESCAERFAAKHRGKLANLAVREFVVTQVRTRSRQEAIEVMTPPWWLPL